MIKESNSKKNIFIKKVLCIFGLLICVLGLCGCESTQKSRTEIFTALKNKKIISNSMEQIDIQTYSSWGLEWCSSKSYYIYKDKDSKMVAISYEYIGHLKDNEYDHLVTVFYDVTINNHFNLINSEDVSCEDGYYSYQNGEHTDNRKYEFGTSKQYEVRVNKGLFKDKYILKEHKNNDFY